MRRVVVTGMIVGVLALLSVGGAGADETITFQGQDVVVGPGGAVTFEVSGHSAEPIGSFGISVFFDEAVLTPTSCLANNVLCVKGALPGELRINGANVAGYSGDVTFATIIFAVGDDPGVYPVEVKVTAVSDVVGTELGHLVESSDGSVTIDAGQAPTPPGDANCDSEVNALDGLALLTALAGGDQACSQIADVNCDDKVSAKDAVALLRALGGLPIDVKLPCDPII